MGLVDYSDSESDSELPQQLVSKLAADGPAPKKPSSNPIARSAAGKIIVNLPTSSAANSAEGPSDEPPTKRARLGGGAGSSRFSNFGSFLPPPKVTKPAASQASRGSAPRPGVHLKTGAEPAFDREANDLARDDDCLGIDTPRNSSLPPPRAAMGPTIPEGQKPEEDVKLVGKPLMFKPLSVARKPAKKKRIVPGAVPKQSGAGAGLQNPKAASAAADASREEPPKKKVSLFSMESEAVSAAETEPETAAVYEPLFGRGPDEDGDGAETYTDQEQSASNAQAQQTLPTYESGQSLSTIADDLNLSKKARRELFGRGGPGVGGAKIVNFNMEHEYAHNEAVRASGEQQAYNPVRAIAPGRHNLRQLVNAAQNNQAALEDSFAANKSNKRDAGSRYGWR